MLRGGFPSSGKFKAEHCRVVWQHMAKLCSNVALQISHGILVLADYTDGDTRRSCELRVALYADATITEEWMPRVPHIPCQTNELGMCGNFDPPHLMKRPSHALDKDGFVMQGEVSYGVLHELHKYCCKPRLELPPYPEDKQDTFDLWHALALVGEATMENSTLPPPLTHAAQYFIVLCMAYAKSLDGIYNTGHRPAVSLQLICEVGYIIYQGTCKGGGGTKAKKRPSGSSSSSFGSGSSFDFGFGSGSSVLVSLVPSGRPRVVSDARSEQGGP